MNKKLCTSALAVLITATLVVPAAFFIAPQRVSAAGATCLGGILGGIIGIGGAAKSLTAVPADSKVENVTTNSAAGSTMGTCVYDMVIVPLLRAAIRAALKQITASTINWINGGSSNSSGQPSYVRNLSVSQQGVGDAAAFSFIAQTATALNSQSGFGFGSSINSALKINYSQQTSLSGFFAANKNTLPQFSQNPNAFLAGNWSQGGVGAWFALTTQTQNNPYTLYQAALGQLSSNVGQAQTNRRQDLIQSGGFMSWCGGDTTAASACVAITSGPKSGSCPAGCVADDSASTGCSPSSNGIKPQAPCTNKDGTPAKASTPGSVIMSYAQANINSGIAQFVSAQDLDSALSAVVSALGKRVIGATGLFGNNQPSGGSTPVVPIVDTSPASPSGVALANTMLDRLTAYRTAWQTIADAALAADTSLKDLQDVCTAAATTNPSFTAASQQAAAAQATRTTKTAPLLVEAVVTSDVIAKFANDLALKVRAEASAPMTSTSSAALSSNIALLMTTPPSVIDITNVQSNAVAGGGVSATPPGSLNVSGGTIIDQMVLININAAALKSVCIPSSPDTGGGGI